MNSQPERRAVFLDRDGVLNRAIVRDGKPYPPSNLEEFEILPNAAQDVRRLRDLGLLAIVISNQPDIARGTQSLAVMEMINRELLRRVPVDDLFVCPHDNADACDCRKPKPGLLYRAAHKYGLNLRKCFMVGDRWRDMDAGSAAGCTTILVDRGYDERAPAMPPNQRVSSLTEAVDYIAQQCEEDVCESSQSAGKNFC